MLSFFSVDSFFTNDRGFASFSLSNNNATIRVTKQRIERLEKVAMVQTTEDVINGVIFKVSAEDNRVQLFFPAKPSDEIRKQLKMRGFKWAPSVGAWQRQISNGALYWGKEIIKNLTSENESTK